MPNRCCKNSELIFEPSAIRDGPTLGNRHPFQLHLLGSPGEGRIDTILVNSVLKEKNQTVVDSSRLERRESSRCLPLTAS